MSSTDQDCSNNHQEAILMSLLQRSINAKEHSHSPYSKFRVGAALLTDTGEIIDGCNVENASYGLSICAERTALVKAVSMGFKKFPAVAVTTDMEEFIAPCGACRQVIAEFGLECDVYLVKSDLSYKKISISELLPLTFTSAELERASLRKWHLFIMFSSTTTTKTEHCATRTIRAHEQFARGYWPSIFGKGGF